jgi:membrane protein YqaA with SNARE-associated domain
MMHQILVKNTFNIVKIALVSACGNWLGDTILYPLDTISTRLKASKHENHNPFIFSYHTIKK